MVVERSGRRRALHGEDRESATKVERVGGIKGGESHERGGEAKNVTMKDREA